MMKKLILLILMLASVCAAQEKPKEAAPLPVSITKEQAATISQSIQAINSLEQQKQLETERLKNYVLTLQLILKLDPSYEFHFDTMTFVKKVEEKKKD
jgi:hypothetical protein